MLLLGGNSNPTSTRTRVAQLLRTALRGEGAGEPGWRTPSSLPWRVAFPSRIGKIPGVQPEGQTQFPSAENRAGEGSHSPALGSRGTERHCRPPGPAPAPGGPGTLSGRPRGAAARRALQARGAADPRAGRQGRRPSPPSRAGTCCSLGWPGAWRGAPSSGALLRDRSVPSLVSCPAKHRFTEVLTVTLPSAGERAGYQSQPKLL